MADAYSFRDEILTRYRTRIQNRDRLKLTKDEQEELIADFVAGLIELEDKEEIAQHCQSEIALLEEGYPVNTIARTRIPEYRKAITNAIAAGILTVTKANSTLVAEETQEIRKHYALIFFAYEPQVYEELKARDAKSNNLKQDELKPVNPQHFLEMASTLLESSNPYELATAIAAVTGRRFSEVLSKGEMAGTKGFYELSFSGQLKKKEAVSAYSIDTLLPATEVLNALYRLRSHSQIQELSGASVLEINAKANAPVNQAVQRHFQETGIVPILAGEAAVTVHNLRGVYGEIAIHFFCPPDMSTHRFVQSRLGHVIGKTALEQQKNSGATEHYFHYYLVDAAGKHLGTKGVLLQETTSLLEEPSRLVPELGSGTQMGDRIPPILEQPLSDEGFVTRAIALLEADWQSQLTALVALTGLAPFDLLKRLMFLEVEGSHRIVYREQLHPADKPLPRLQTLAPAATVLQAIEALRQHPESTQLLERLSGRQIDRQASSLLDTALPQFHTASVGELQERYARLVSSLPTKATPVAVEPAENAVLESPQVEQFSKTVVAGLDKIYQAIQHLGDRLSVSGLGMAHESFERENQHLEGQNEQLRQENQQLQLQNKQLRQEADALQLRLEQLQAAEATIQQQLAQISQLLPGLVPPIAPPAAPKSPPPANPERADEVRVQPQRPLTLAPHNCPSQRLP
ncbi:MAG: hypothetical protein HC890_02380 [Chloroflexaceae bacterium]|nr:hypothetical protein [Chloroflexaceae bacterium]